MRCFLTMAAFFLGLLGAGCQETWQANRASQAVNVNPFGVASGEPVFTPSNSPGYINGDSQDMRTRH
jgi:hypothetical protein